jgi:hypothetical protein
MFPLGFAASFAVALALRPCPPFDNSKDTWKFTEAPDTMYAVRWYLSTIENDGPEELIRRGKRMFPIYLKLLSNPCVGLNEKARLLYVVRQVDADRSMFIDSAVALMLLQTKTTFVHHSATHLLTKIGGPKEAMRVAPLLSDSDPDARANTAYLMAEIGGADALDVLDGKPRDEADRRRVAEQRDRLKDRLEKGKGTPPKK